MNCPKCNTPLADGAQFCENCGEKITSTVTCQNCGMQTSAESASCQSCGAPTAKKAEKAEGVVVAKKPIQIPKKLLSLGAAALAIVLVVIMLGSLIFGGSGKKVNYALYIKDKEVVYSNLKKATEISTRLFDFEVENSTIADRDYEIARHYTLSKDGKIMFFIDKIDSTAAQKNAYTLYYRYVDKPNKDPVKIDSDVLGYTVNLKGNCVTYLKYASDGCILYQHNLKDKTKIAGDVESYYVSEDGKKIVYRNKEDSIYLKNGKKDAEKLESEIGNIQYITEDFSKIYFTKEGSLYMKQGTKDKVKIASDIYSVIGIYETGEVFYTKKNEGASKLIDFVNDDIKAADAALTEPQAPNRNDYPTYSAYSEALTEYNTKVQEYDAKLMRDQLRQTLSEISAPNMTRTLCYFNGKEEVKISDNYSSGYNSAYERAVLVFRTLDSSSMTAVKLSEITSVDAVYNAIEASRNATTYNVAIKGTAHAIEVDGIEDIAINRTGKVLYYMAEVNEEGTRGELYKLEIGTKKLGKATLYDTDVSTDTGCYFIDNGKEGKGESFMYYKDIKDGKGTLYINKKKIDDDVRIYNVAYLYDAKKVVYFVDWNREKAYGTLMSSNLSGKSTKHADDVYDFTITPDEDILYLADYSLTNYKGDLYIANGKKGKKLDTDVVSVLPYYDRVGMGTYTYTGSYGNIVGGVVDEH